MDTSLPVACAPQGCLRDPFEERHWARPGAPSFSVYNACRHYGRALPSRCPFARATLRQGS
eukprot:1387531-Alexandrium_andersonii.AAC.1